MWLVKPQKLQNYRTKDTLLSIGKCIWILKILPSLQFLLQGNIGRNWKGNTFIF